jgi:hypothetical protein
MTARWSGGSAANAAITSSEGPQGASGAAGSRASPRDLAAQLPRARVVDRPVDDDPVQPGAEGAAAVEAIQRADRGEERLLRDVLGGGRVVDDEPGGAVRARPVAAEELGEGLGRAALRGAY